MIYTNNNIIFINFKSYKNETNKLFTIGYDDDISSKKRELIREHYIANSLPYQSIYEKEKRQTEYGMAKILNPLLNQPKIIDKKHILGLPISNVMSLGNNSYRGQTLVNHPDYLKVLKDSGIKTVIDLCNNPKYAELVKEAGLKYFCLDMKTPSSFGYGFWNNECFYDISYYREKNWGQDLNFEELCRDKIDSFIKFVELLNNGNYYIGCEFGTNDTDDALLINSFLNPNTKINENIPIYKIDGLKSLYSKLTPNDKKLLGWSQNYDKEFIPKLKCLEKNFFEKISKF